LNEDRRENPEYAASGSSDCKMDRVMQRLLEVTQCSFGLHFADFLPHVDSARDSLTAEPQRRTKGGAAVRGGGSVVVGEVSASCRQWATPYRRREGSQTSQRAHTHQPGHFHLGTRWSLEGKFSSFFLKWRVQAFHHEETRETLSSETDLNDADLLLEEHARRAERNEETNSNRKHENRTLIKGECCGWSHKSSGSLLLGYI
jgi:hypothetical protein